MPRSGQFPVCLNGVRCGTILGRRGATGQEQSPIDLQGGPADWSHMPPLSDQHDNILHPAGEFYVDGPLWVHSVPNSLVDAQLHLTRAVSEPSTLALASLGLLVLVGYRRRRAYRPTRNPMSRTDATRP